MNSFLSILFSISCLISIGQEMRIGLLRTIKIQKVNISVKDGSYQVFGDSLESFDFIEGLISVSSGKVKVDQGGAHQYFDTVYIRNKMEEGSFLIRSILPSSKNHIYKGDIEVTVSDNRLNVVNLVNMWDYLGGVIESEGGAGRHIEYYKVQALMSRTYALKNKNRHFKEGFSLCDGVHCQAYHNMQRHSSKINEAVQKTKGEVILDHNNELVTTYFAANCGGQTCDASYIWNESEPFLSSFRDTFCIHTKQAIWEKKIEKWKWKTFLEKEYGVLESEYGDLLYEFKQPFRKAFYIHPSLGIPLRDIRKKFRLKSTFFSSSLEGDYVIIRGRGFGHGVGLCQEGAMNMALSGYSYRQIAHFYFEKIRIVNYNRNQFFSQEEVFILDEK